jgi:hypothetical protein
MKPVNRLSVVALLAGSIIVLAGCSAGGKKAQALAVDPPFRNADVASSNFEIDAERGDTISTATGSRIYISAGALVDANGNPVTGKVNISYREFQKAADIIASGILMTYDSAGVTKDFETAGMFEIGAATASGNNPVFIKKGTPVKVDIASYRDESNFNFYVLDKEQNKWVEKTKSLPAEENQLLKAVLDEKKPLPPQPAEPQPYDGKSRVFELDMNYDNYPELEGYNGIVWQAAQASDTRNPETAETPEWVYTERWTGVTIEQENAVKMTYRMRLRNPKKSYETIVKPVLSGNNLEKARRKFALKKREYQQADSARRAMAADMKYGPYQRSVSIESFGIYNCDRYYSMPAVVRTKASYNFNIDEFDESPDKVRVFLLAGAQKIPIRFSGNGDRIVYSESEINKMIAVLPGTNKVAVISAADFRNAAKNASPEHISITFQPRQAVIENIEDLQFIINEL